MEKIRKTIYRHILSIILVVGYPIAQTLSAMKFIDYSKAFLLDLRLCFWLGLVFLLGVEAFRNAAQVLIEYRNSLTKPK